MDGRRVGAGRRWGLDRGGYLTYIYIYILERKVRDGIVNKPSLNGRVLHTSRCYMIITRFSFFAAYCPPPCICSAQSYYHVTRDQRIRGWTYQRYALQTSLLPFRNASKTCLYSSGRRWSSPEKKKRMISSVFNYSFFFKKTAHLVRGKGFTGKVLGTGVETSLDKTRVESHKVLHL